MCGRCGQSVARVSTPKGFQDYVLIDPPDGLCYHCFEILKKAIQAYKNIYKMEGYLRGIPIKPRIREHQIKQEWWF